MTRREWLTAGIAGATALAVASRTRAAAVAGAESAPSGAVLRFSHPLNKTNPTIGSLAEQVEFLERTGFEAVELRGKVIETAKDFQAVLRNSKLKVSGMDWGSHFGAMVSDSKQEREKSLDFMKRSIEVAGELKAPTIVVVPPRLGREFPPVDPALARKILLETLPAMGELAAQAGTCLVIEPVRSNISNIMHTVVEVAAFCRDCKAPGIGLVADFFHMVIEETNQTGAMLSGGEYIKQVHLSSRNRKFPGQESEDGMLFAEGFKGLKMIGYRHYCSFECGKDSPAYKDDVVKSMDFLRNLWSQA